MALEITKDGPSSYKAKSRLWKTADGSRLVEEGDPEAAFFFAAEGNPITAADAKAFGLADDDDEADEGDAEGDDAESKAEGKPAATKAQAKPAATKAESGPKAKKGK